MKYRIGTFIACLAKYPGQDGYGISIGKVVEMECGAIGYLDVATAGSGEGCSRCEETCLDKTWHVPQRRNIGASEEPIEEDNVIVSFKKLVGGGKKQGNKLPRGVKSAIRTFMKPIGWGRTT